MNNCDNPNQTQKVAFDPGWNDPPNLSYTTQNTTPSRPRNFLNKRVAFPSSGDSPSAGPSPLVNLPPIPTVPLVLPVQSIPKGTTDVEDVNIDSESALKDVKDILLGILDNSGELGSKVTDIKRRLSVMEEMWINDKLNKRIHFQMKELAHALRENKPNKADDIHRAMMVDHVSAVGSWMPGVKQIIHHSIARCELLAMDKE